VRNVNTATDHIQGITGIFNAQITLGANALNALLEKWNHVRILNRHEFLARPGEVETNLFFVSGGTMRIYYPNESEEICVGFAYANTLICSYPSFISQSPSQYFIQALTKTRLVSISRKEFYSLFESHPLIERCWRLLEEQALLGKIEREVEMLTFTPEERYTRLLERSPHIFQLIPRKYIASYLRMSPETLSRLGS
jgi:CRP-like cAMP-binding protein